MLLGLAIGDDCPFKGGGFTEEQGWEELNSES